MCRQIFSSTNITQDSAWGVLWLSAKTAWKTAGDNSGYIPPLNSWCSEAGRQLSGCDLSSGFTTSLPAAPAPTQRRTSPKTDFLQVTSKGDSPTAFGTGGKKKNWSWRSPKAVVKKKKKHTEEFYYVLKIL